MNTNTASSSIGQILLFGLSFVVFSLALYLIVSDHVPVTRVDTPGTRDSTLTTAEKQVVSKDGSETTNEKSLVIQTSPPVAPAVISLKEVHDLAYNYFILSAILLMTAFLLPRIENITLPGGASVQLREEVKALKEQANLAQEESTKAGGILREDGHKMEDLRRNFKQAQIARTTKPITDASDPQKGRWGKLSLRNGRELTAQVTARENSPYFDVVLQVKSTSATNPLGGVVKFHLHDTFANPNPIITADKGVAELRLTAWGAFTVGAEADNGATTLELDLAKLPGAPEAFKNA